MVTIIDVNGAEMYAHTAWAESPDGDSFSTVEFDDADYIGTLIDRNAAEETDPTKYTWRYADAGMEEDEEDEEDEDVTADLSSDLEELADNVAEVADQINQQQVDFINTQNVTDGAIGNVNELNGTNNGVHGWTVPDGFRVSQSYEDVDANPDTDKVLVSTITRNTSGTDAAVTFDATELVRSLSGADAGNAYTISLQSRMSELFEIPVSVAESDGTNVMLDFGVINNAVTVEPEEPEEEDAGTAEAAEEDPTVDEIIADEEGADDAPTGEIAGAGAWSWFESTAETASVTAAAQELRFDLAEMPVGAELSIANLKIEAGAMATPWRRSIKEVAGIAAEAQSTADDARAEATMAQSTATAASRAADSAARAAATAQSKADEASTAAATAQTKADEASAAASTAQSSAATAAQAAATAQSTADAAKASASSASNAASAAQTKANEAASAAATAQSKADSAGTAAAKAQSSANAAGEAASSAQAAAEAAQTAAGTAQADIDSQKEYFWHDANGAHVLGSKTASTRYRTDIDSEGMHIKDVSGEIQEVAKFTADGAQIGKNGEARQNMDYNSWKLTDKDGKVFAEVRDIRDKDGKAEVIENLTSYGIKYITLQMAPVSESETYIMVGTRKLMPGEYSISGRQVTLSMAPDVGTELKITYKTYSDLAKAYTFGKRLEDVGVGFHSFAEGYENRAYGTASHAEGEGNESGGKASHAEGSGNVAKGNCSHAEGKDNTAEDEASHAEGNNSTASGKASHAEGSGTAIGQYSHAEGFSTVAKVQYTHAEGYETKATKDASHAEGAYTEARGKYSHAEGYRTIADTDYSHAEGWNTQAQGYASHAGGTGTFAGFGNQTAIGQYNDNQTDSLFEIGNGTYTSHSNAFRVTKDGKAYDGERCLSDIGTVYRAEKDVAITTASINTRVKAPPSPSPQGYMWSAESGYLIHHQPRAHATSISTSMSEKIWRRDQECMQMQKITHRSTHRQS